MMMQPGKKPCLPPCKVCNGVATGFHYGANTCEACKAFFRRYFGKEHMFKPCKNNHSCLIKTPSEMNMCKKCRFRKCVNVGMALECVKKGRYTYQKRWRNAQELQKNQTVERIQKYFNPELSTHLLGLLKQSFNSHYPDILFILEESENIKKELLSQAINAQSGYSIKLRKHIDLQDPKANDEEDQFYENLEAALCQSYVDKNERTSYLLSKSHDAMKMIWLGLSSCFESQLASAVRYAKDIPGFVNLSINDQEVLLMESYIEVLVLLRCISEFTDQRVFIKYYPTSQKLKAIPVDVLSQQLGNDFCEYHTRLAAQINKLRLTAELVSILIGLIILSPDRNLENPKMVEVLQHTLLNVLQFTIQQNYPSNVKDLADVLLLLPKLRESSLVHFTGSMERTEFALL